jgi:predicted phosphodiesterase
MTKKDICRSYIKKFPNFPNAKLSRIILKENPLMFDNVENIRTMIRSITGNLGQNKHKKDAEFHAPPKTSNPYKLPESDETDFKPYVIKATRVLVMSDIHIPYHSISALTAVFDYTKNMNIDAVLLNGDVLDFFGLSRYCKDPKKRNFSAELKAFEEFMNILNDIYKCKIYFKLGNHEERYNHFLWMKAGEIADVEEFKLEEILKKRAKDVSIISDKRIIRLGHLNVLHGHEFSGGVFSPVNIARGLFLKAKASAMQGHNHQTSEHSESNLEGKLTTTFSLGCLCELNPEYMPINKWNHGFAIVDIDDKGNFEVSNKRILKGKVL